MSSATMRRYAETNNLKLVDAKKPLEIEVLPEDIRRADRKKPQSCGFAKACRRMDNDIRAAYFFQSTAYLEFDDKIVRYSLPKSMQKEIVAFDRAKAME